MNNYSLIVACMASCWLSICGGVQAKELHAATRHNNLERVQYLLENGPPGLVNQRMEGGITALHISAALNYDTMTALLLEHGAKIDIFSENGFAPLHWAASRDATTSLAILLQHGADVNMTATNGITALHWASFNQATNAVDLLVKNGADIQAETRTRLKPIHWAIRNKAEDLALKLALEDSLQGVPANQPARQTHGKAPEELPQLKQTTPGAPLQVPLPGGTALDAVWIKSLKAWVGKYEVTNEQFRHFKPTHHVLGLEHFDMNQTNHPVAGVTWDEAVAFCDWLTTYYQDLLPEKYVFRLPTEWEWEQVALCGKDWTYPWGNKMPPKYGNFSDLSAKPHLKSWTGLEDYDDGFVVTCPVELSGESKWGLFGIAGNVSEWCSDWYSARQQYKIRKGGGWAFDTEDVLKIHARAFDRPGVRYFNTGFRIVAGPVIELKPTGTQLK
jgi:formylglycine-generating enzyme required for sulfatase activity